MAKLGFFDIPKLIIFHAQLEEASCYIKQTAWNAYFTWHLEASKRKWSSNMLVGNQQEIAWNYIRIFKKSASQDMKATTMSINRWKDKEEVVHVHNEY